MSASKDLRGFSYISRQGKARKGASGSSLGRCSTYENGEVDHLQMLSSQFGNLLRTQEQTDVTFLVEDERFEAHRIILSARCEYFRALLYGGLKETTNCDEEIPLHDTPAKSFRRLLEYIYTGMVSLKSMDEKDVIDLLVLANRYSLLTLESAITGYLREIINVLNVTDIYDVASLFDVSDLEMACLTFMDHNASEIVVAEGFARLSKTAALALTSRKSFCAPEILIFKGVRNWIKENGTEGTAELLSSVRLPLIDIQELLHSVRESKLYSSDKILDAVQAKTECNINDMPSRGFLVEDENLAQHCYGAEVLTGEMKESLLEATSSSYDLEKGYTRHVIQEDAVGIIVDLGKPSIINTVKLSLWDLDTRSYSYKIEHSMDKENWSCIVDYSGYMCRSSQILHFEQIVTRYVKLLGTSNTLNRCFHLVMFECMNSTNCLPVQDGFIVPRENISSVSAKAIVLDGVSRNRNALIDGDTRNHDLESGYTCHQIGSGCITIQLAQPFMIGSMRMLLWDCDDRSYSYYIQISLDRKNWTTVCDKREEACRSWQTITFTPRPISFIKIIGTNNTSNEVFHVVHFECPASEDFSSGSSTTESVATDED
eukprot:gene19817-21756_t